MQQFFKNFIGPLFLVSYFLYIPLSWILVLRDGRAVYTILDFYPQLTSGFKSIEPHLVQYGINSIPTILFFVLGIFLFFLYVVSLRIKFSVKQVVFWTIAFQAVVFFSYPSLSTDIFSYIFSDRIATVYHENVWTTKPIMYNEDPFSRLSDWHNNTRVYGGVNQFIYTAPSYLGGNNLLLLVSLYKLVVWVFTLASLWIVYVITHKYYKGKEAISLQLIFWNPLFLIEIVGSGHNDILMLFFMLCAWFFYLDKRIVLAGIAIALAFQVKIIAFVLCVFLLGALVKEKQYKKSIYFLVSFGVVTQGIFLLMDIDPISFGKAVLFNTGVYWQGFPAVLQKIYEPGKFVLLSIFVGIFLFFLYKQYKKSIDPVTLYVSFMTIYLLFFASAYWNWYVVWVLAFIPFISSKRLMRLILVFSFTSFMLYPVYWISLRFQYEHIFWTFFTYFAMVGLPLFVYFMPKQYGHYLLKE